MKKKSVKLVAAVGVLVVLSGAYVGVKTYVAKQDAKETESEEENDETKEIVSISSDDVKSIKFIIDKKEVTFEKDGDTWIKNDESEFPVDQDKLDTLAGSFYRRNSPESGRFCPAGTFFRRLRNRDGRSSTCRS